MIQKIKPLILKIAPRYSVAWYFFNFIYHLFSGSYYASWKGAYRRRRQIKNMPIYGAAVFDRVIRICHGLGMNPFLIRGTLLGHCRSGGLLPGDYDIDLGLLAGDFAHIESLEDRVKNQGFRIQHDARYVNELRKIGERFSFQITDPSSGLWVDFDLFYPINHCMAYIEDRRFEYLYAKKEFKDGKTLDKNIIGFALVYPEEIFQDFKKVSFLNHEILVPLRSEQYLEKTYGDWRIPRKKSEAVYQNMKGVTYDSTTGRFDFRDIHG